MIVDLKQGDIKVIMVKDLSRLGRDYIGVGDYIEQIFPLMGVRFIAVNNSFDSMKLNNGTPGIEVAVSNLVNNMYSRDIAKKIRAALETNWKNGKATCTNVPFGYVWNKKGGQRWEIDPEAAPCVKKVFELALSGRNTTQIAYGMNELNLPTPGLYAKRKNLLMGSNPIIAPDSEMLWNAAIVWRILRRYEYTGALVMGRRKKIDVNTTSVRTLPEDKWIIAENAHEAIVTKDEYYQAQKAIRNVTPIQYKVDDDFALKGKICCGNCNRQLRHERQYGEMVFYCGYKRSAGKFSKCYGGYYREYSVNAKVARAIKTVFYALDVVNQGMQEKQSITVRCVDIEDLEKQAEAIRVEQIKLYESYADGVLRRDVYIVVRGCDENDKDALRWCVAKPDKRKSRKMSCKPFATLVYQKMGWDSECRYKMLGYRITFEGETLYVFDLLVPEIFHEGQRKKNAVDSQDNAASTKPVNSRKGFYLDDIVGTFGVPVEEHRKESEVKQMDGYVSMGILTGKIAPEAGKD